MAHGPFRRILLKVSGEALMGDAPYGLDWQTLAGISDQIDQILKKRIEVAIVVGGGNIFRGVTGAKSGMDRATADYAGMLATVINGLALQDALERAGVATRVQTGLEIRAVAEPYIRRRAIRHLEKGRVVIFAGGSGNPYMTTDTAAALRALEIDADVLLMAKNRVDGVYDADPHQVAGARRFDQLSYLEALKRELEVMDGTALSLCRENRLPILVFNLQVPGNIVRAATGQVVGTLISEETPA
ncbi:MAG TPA: UMP kinase [Dehalococcoidia bacterium]|nr:UMP kinase [Dehalococcoidia bacterium]